MAQWSVDRRDIENMRITKNSSGGDLKVMIEEDDIVYGDPPPRYRYYFVAYFYNESYYINFVSEYVNLYPRGALIVV